MNSRLDNVIAPTGSSAHHRLLAKEVAKRERVLLQQGIVPAEGDFYVGTVLIKADALDQLEELRDRDLEAEFSLADLRCRVVQISGRSGIVQLLAPDLAVLKGRRQDLGYHLVRAFHKGVFHEILAWKEGNGPPALLDRDGKKLLGQVVQAKLPVLEVVEERPAMPPAVEPRLQAPSRAARWAPARVGSGTSSALGAAVLPSSTTSQRSSFLPSPSSVSPGGA